MDGSIREALADVAAKLRAIEAGQFPDRVYHWPDGSKIEEESYRIAAAVRHRPDARLAVRVGR